MLGFLGGAGIRPRALRQTGFPPLSHTLGSVLSKTGDDLNVFIVSDKNAYIA